MADESSRNKPECCISLIRCLLLIGLAGLAACTTLHDGKIHVPERRWLASSSPYRIGPKTAFEAKVTQSVAGKPPLIRLTVEVVLRNGWHKPRWFLIPHMLPRVPVGQPGGVYAVEGYVVDKAGRCLIALLHGSEESSALLLPGKGEAQLKGLEIDYWQEEPAKPIELVVRAAENVLIDGEPLQAWFDGYPVSDSRVSADYAGREFLGRRGKLGDKEGPLVLTEEQAFVVAVTLPPLPDGTKLPAKEGK